MPRIRRQTGHSWRAGIFCTIAALLSSLAAAAEPPGTIEFVGRNLFGAANGTFHSWRIERQSVDLAAPAASEVVVVVDLASLDTDNSKRDEHLRTADFFDVATHPTATVRGHSLRRIEAADPEAQDSLARYAVSFDIDLHGVQKTVEGEVELLSENPTVVEGRLTIDRVDFGVGKAPSKWNPMSIKAEVPVTFRLEL